MEDFFWHQLNKIPAIGNCFLVAGNGADGIVPCVAHFSLWAFWNPKLCTRDTLDCW